MAKVKEEKNCRLNRVGGQAVLEGVMMKAGNRTVTTCRKEDGELVVNDAIFSSVRKKHKILDIPILRGVVNFVEMMVLSVKTLNASADALGIEDEESKSEKWMKKHLGVGVTDVIMGLGVVLGVLLAVALFMFLPTLTAEFVNWILTSQFHLAPLHESWVAVIEGVAKVLIFVIYIALVGLIPDIKRTFMYHGAEHKSIACFESGDELTPENAMKHKRFHPRCGTSFMFLMILLGIAAGMFVRNIIPGLEAWAYTLIRLAILPIVMGVGYEILMLAGKHDNFLTRAISAPGIWMQRLTTKEPTEDMLEVAIVSIKCALRDDFPEFREFYKNRGWETQKAEKAEEISEAIEETSQDSNMANTEDVVREKSEECADGDGNNGATEVESADDNVNIETTDSQDEEIKNGDEVKK